MNTKNIQKGKSAIIGKAWLNGPVVGIVPASYTLPETMTFNADESYLVNGMTFRTDRNTTIPVTVEKGQKLFFYANTKREGKNDPDFSVSVIMTEEAANAYIENSREGSENWKKENSVATA